MLLEFATSAIFFTSASNFYKLKLVADQMEVALFEAKNGVDAVLLGRMASRPARARSELSARDRPQPKGPGGSEMAGQGARAKSGR